ncbi:MAG: putative homoserine kinase type (protein kinase fold)-like protein [Anaerosolibacter sp.]|uniref:phosphotransferase n=1 Tax=Anaerosolibacter sp. TaxID=1872527 RepID=UPI00261363D9|nr:phosphotransferase [Anaerosolibacter sp.]MDF2546531.1 putative homoserine kinase type (protein kinase fold)-like protein [Anaerosolibacter sp.]
MDRISWKEKKHLNDRLLGIEDVEYICMQFDIGKLKYIHGHIKNTVNINILTETEKGKYIIKFSYIDEHQLINIVEAIKTLKENGIPALLPLQTINNQHYIKLKNYRIQVTPFIVGHSFNRNPKQMFSSGEVLKKMHDVLSDYDKIPVPRSSVYPSTEVLNKGITRLELIKHNFNKEKILLIYRLYDEIQKGWNDKEKELPHTVIHGDWHERNQLFTKEGTVCCVFDFDYIQRKERLFDIAYALWNFLNRSQMKIFAEPFMQGYGLLEEQEIAALQLAIARVSFFFLCTASLNEKPINEMDRQLREQVPFLEYILSKDGQKRIGELCYAFKR